MSRDALDDLADCGMANYGPVIGRHRTADRGSAYGAPQNDWLTVLVITHVENSHLRNVSRHGRRRRKDSLLVCPPLSLW